MGKIETSKPKVLWGIKCKLGEGVIWVREHYSVYFVDIKKKKIHCLNLKNQSKKTIKINKEIGFIIHIKRNNFILGLKNELRILNLKTKRILWSMPVEKNLKRNRINDGATDLNGMLWFGTMDDSEKNIKNGSLYYLNHKLKLGLIDKNYLIPNGPTFIDNYNFYHTDTKKKIIYKIRINKNFKIIKKIIFKKFKKKDGSPDGMILDTKNNLWVCHYHKAKITALNKKGKKVHEINFPAKNITNCVFGGYKNSELFVTTAIKGMNKKELKLYPFSGNLFKVKTNVFGKTNKKFKINI